jgi:DNA-binding LacI/PurR family transcriptional regulator
MHERQRGYRQALADAGIQIHESDIRYTRLTPKAGEEVMEQMGDSIRENDAVFCLADMMAVGVIRSFKRRGIRIPEDVALVAFSDIIEAELFAVPMTTVRQEALEVGKIAGKHLLKRIKAQTDPNYEPPATETIVLNTKLIVRDSTPPLID